MGLYPTDWPRCNRGKCTHHCAPQWFVGDAAQDFWSLTTTSLLPMICDPKKCRKEIILNHHKLVLWCFVSPPVPQALLWAQSQLSDWSAQGFSVMPSSPNSLEVVVQPYSNIFFSKNVFKYPWKTIHIWIHMVCGHLLTMIWGWIWSLWHDNMEVFEYRATAKSSKIRPVFSYWNLWFGD